MNDPAVNEKGAGTEDTVAVLVPSYKTPLLAGELLHAAAASGSYTGCQFVLLLDLRDPYLGAYKELVDGIRTKGLSLGYFIFDGTPYCGQINRVAPLLRARCVCVTDNRHLPMGKGKPLAEVVQDWLALSPQDMRVGTFTDDGFFPLVTRKLIDRLGYMFHPLAYGRFEAEEWLLQLARHLDVLSPVADTHVIVSPADGVETVGYSDPSDSNWVGRTLMQILDDEEARLREFVVK